MPKPRWFPLLIAVLLAALAAPPAAARDDAPISDPIPEDPVQSRLGLVLEEFAQFPKTEPTPAPTDPRLMRHARINHLGQLPDGRMYVPDLNGRIYLLDPKEPTPRVYLDVGAAFAPDFFSGRGLGTGSGFVAFHPDFARNGKLYTVHTEWGAALQTKTPDWNQDNPHNHGVITEWTAEDPSADVFQGTRREVMRFGFGTQIHGFQQISFNPYARPGSPEYGKLYIAAGDGGRGVTGNDPQDMSRPYGKILRIDPMGRDSANGEYGIPADNPFAGRPGTLGEIYAVGMRDPHRFSWDPGKGHRILLGHIGEHAIEAIYDVRAGDNLGWSRREGAFVWKQEDRCNLYPLPADDAQYGYNYPVAAYDHDPPAGHPCTSDSGNAVAGGYVYRGKDVPGLRGKYVFGDIVNGRILATDNAEMRRGKPRAPIHELMVYADGKRTTMQELVGSSRVDLRFGEDLRGELYVLAKATGTIWKVVGTRTFADCKTGGVKVSHADEAADWAPVTPAKWQFPGREVVLAEAGTERPGPRRPFEYAVLTKGPRLGSVRIDGEVRLDTPPSVSNRDVILVFGHQSDTRFYYVHLSQDNRIYPHNGIFVVNDADRLRIDDQWNAFKSKGAPPAVTDSGWHRVRVTHCADTGEIAVYVDGARDPLMTAVDTTFGSGRVGFGSFDNIGRLRDLRVRGTAAES
ncbi:Glucose/arabinose dehydrogenase, beta-propeller fold [Thermomonospora echinospora]|uniref:Glucose/arabinose dehydrogenase, beta-propeller fold n=1 Tax=Thermomonospora echinospora TaxID=1992 RepID=A0A1H5TLL3_9ACTN|nr:PQQ-dependent sugar dehydrogenase [Thermomonospora echinospora]SEF63001.1 Glucose/arabinose dehydrogenase, beta-propeller fold [Thermomonospora echinospora]